METIQTPRPKEELLELCGRERLVWLGLQTRMVWGKSNDTRLQALFASSNERMNGLLEELYERIKPSGAVTKPVTTQ